MALVHSTGSTVWSSILPTIATAAGTPATVDAAGESSFTIGRVRLRGGSGSKTISAAGGGAIHWRVGASSTFANGSTNLRLGIQDLSGAVEDGTFDVRADLVGGTDTVAANAIIRTPMEVGSKVLTHGQEIAIGHEMTARGGADAVQLMLVTRALFTDTLNLYPYRTADTGSGPAVGTTVGLYLIEFDDGTVGWIDGIPWTTTLGTYTSAAINTGTTPDEYVAGFQVPVPIELGMAVIGLAGIASTDAFELILYADPFGTPSVILTDTITQSRVGSTSGTVQPYNWQLSTPQALAANTDYGIAARPTTANSINYAYMQPGANIGRKMKACTEFVLGSLKVGSRINQTGAFTETDQDDIPYLAIVPTAFDDGSGSGSGSVVVPSLGYTGMRAF